MGVEWVKRREVVKKRKKKLKDRKVNKEGRALVSS